MDTLNDLNERVDAFVGTSSFDTPVTATTKPIDVPPRFTRTLSPRSISLRSSSQDEFTEPQVAVTPNGLLPMEPLPIDGRLRKAAFACLMRLRRPAASLFGRRIKSLIYTTDVAGHPQLNADAVFAVYPSRRSPPLRRRCPTVAECLVFWAGGRYPPPASAPFRWQLPRGCRVRRAVWVNSATAEMVEHITNIADIPVIATVVRCDDDAHAKVRAGAKILNIAAGKNTPQVLRELREHYPNLPLIAPGGKTPESIRETIAAGANAIIWTPPSAQQLQTDMMQRYRKMKEDATPVISHDDVPIIDQVAAAEVSQVENMNPDVPIPDEVIERVASIHDHIEERRANRGLKPSLHGFFFRGKKR